MALNLEIFIDTFKIELSVFVVIDNNQEDRSVRFTPRKLIRGCVVYKSTFGLGVLYLGLLGPSSSEVVNFFEQVNGLFCAHTSYHVCKTQCFRDSRPQPLVISHYFRITARVSSRGPDPRMIPDSGCSGIPDPRHPCPRGPVGGKKFLNFG